MIEIRYPQIDCVQWDATDFRQAVRFDYCTGQQDGISKAATLRFASKEGYTQAYRSLDGICNAGSSDCIAVSAAGIGYVDSVRFERMTLKEQLGELAVGMRFRNVRRCEFGAHIDGYEFEGEYQLSFWCDAHAGKLTLPFEGYDATLNELLRSWRAVSDPCDLVICQGDSAVKLKFVSAGAPATSAA